MLKPFRRQAFSEITENKSLEEVLYLYAEYDKEKKHFVYL